MLEYYLNTDGSSRLFSGPNMNNFMLRCTSVLEKKQVLHLYLILKDEINLYYKNQGEQISPNVCKSLASFAWIPKSKELGLLQNEVE